MKIEEVPLGSIALITMGLSPTGDTYNNHGEGISLLNGPTEFGETYPNCTLFTTDSKRECEKGDLIFCVRGSTTGRMNWADKVYSLGRGVCSITGEISLDTKYIRYCLELKLDALLKNAGGGTFPNLRKDDLLNFKIPYPTYRGKIASILSAYDDLIENNNRRIKILEEMAQAIYKEWFVNFRFPGHEKVKMVKSELGMIPKGWEVVKSSDAVEINPTIRVDKNKSKPYVDMGGLSETSMIIKSKEQRAGSNGSKFINGDILFARITPCLENGKTGFVQFLDVGEEGIGSTEFIVLRSKSLSPEFVYLLARSEDFRNNAIKSMTGASGRQRVQPECFDKFQLAQPGQNVLDKFTEIVRPMFQNIHRLDLKNKNLRKTRDLLLPKLVRGEIGVESVNIAESA